MYYFVFGFKKKKCTKVLIKKKKKTRHEGFGKTNY